jgi:hypothetical protein
MLLNYFFEWTIKKKFFNGQFLGGGQREFVFAGTLTEF